MNFQDSICSTPSGHLRDIGQTYGLKTNGYTYGWSANNFANTRNRDAGNSPDQRYDTLAHMQLGSSNSWEIAVPNGTYWVRVVAGDPSYFDSVYKINAENTLVVNGTPSSGTRWIEGTANVTVSDGRLTLSNASGAVNNKLGFVEITDATRTGVAPSAPSNLSVRAYSSTGVDIVWTDNSDNETAFLIEQSPNGTSNWTQVANWWAASVFKPHSNLSPSTTYYWRARATNGAGSSAYSNVASVTTPANNSQAAYGGTPWSTGSQIEAEDFDTGDEGVASHETDSTNIGGLYRATTVDVSNYFLNGSGYFVGWNNSSEWLEYTVNVTQAGTYRLDVNLASVPGGANFHVEFNGVNKTGAITVPNTGGWTTYQTISRNGINLASGQQVVRFAIDGWTGGGTDVGNFNWFKLVRTDSPPPNPAPTVATPAAASPSPVTGATTNLSVLGADNGGEANLAYTWSVVVKPSGAIDPTYNRNGTNTAKTALATFYKAGAYTFRATISDGMSSVTSDVVVTVNQMLSRIDLTPAAVTLSNSATRQFSASAKDQFGQSFTSQPSFVWSLAAGGVGSINSSGLYTAPSSGGGSATVRATSASTTGTASVTISASSNTISLTASAASTDSVSLSWSAVAGANSYKVEVSFDGTTFNQSTELDATGTTATVQGLDVGMT
ncbi:MAG: carbohydrate-binding protein, partial [Tepidisphaeraceae bacterium]